MKGEPPRSTRRYYVAATRGVDAVELFKLEQAPQRLVITSSVVGRMTETASIHATHHPPKRGSATRIVHISDARGTDVRIGLDPSAPAVELMREVVDLAALDWAAAKKFAKQGYDEIWRHDVELNGTYIDARFYIGEPSAMRALMERPFGAEFTGMLIPRPGGFGTAPGGHKINHTRLIFDDEAEETVGCVLLSCHPPELGPPSADEPWAGEHLNWLAYGSGGKIAQGTTESAPPLPPDSL